MDELNFNRKELEIIEDSLRGLIKSMKKHYTGSKEAEHLLDKVASWLANTEV